MCQEIHGAPYFLMRPNQVSTFLHSHNIQTFKVILDNLPICVYFVDVVFADNTELTTLFMTKQNSGSLLSSSRDIIFEEICRNSSSETKSPSSSNKMLRAALRRSFSKSQSKCNVSMSSYASSLVACTPPTTSYWNTVSHSGINGV